MSALPPKADIAWCSLDVRFVPEAEVAAIRSVELIVQPDAKDAIDEMRVCGDWPPVTLPMSTNGTAVVTVTPKAVASSVHVFNATPGSFWTSVKVGRLQAAALLILK